MPRYVIFNTVNSDGVGDFTHMEDIMKSLLSNPKYRSVEFIPIIYFIEGELASNYERIHQKIKDFGIQFFYGKKDDHLRFSKNEAFQRLLSEADQAILISYDAIFELYEPYLKQGIPIKYIGEHEAVGIPSSILSRLGSGRDWGTSYKSRSLGLSRKCQGIKIQHIPQITPEMALSIIRDDNPDFLTQLLVNTHSVDFKTFNDNNIVIPAYFNITLNFLSFLHLLSINGSLTDKNIVIYHSGTSLDFLENETSNILISDLFRNSNISQIEIIKPNSPSSIRIYENQHGLKAIKILSGLYLSDTSFNAIWQLAKIAGVCGDNTLERCISMDVLPYYWSTNAPLKMPTLLALQQITQLPELMISQEARESYKIFFDPNEYFAHNGIAESPHRQRPTKFSLLHFAKMIESWPIVTAYIKQNHSFYNNLDKILLEALPPQSLPPLCKEDQAVLTKDLLAHTFLGYVEQSSKEQHSEVEVDTSLSTSSPALTITP